MKNLFNTCVWQDKWVHPFESAWGLCHKFRIVNAISGEEFRKLMKFPPYSAYHIQEFNSDFGLYCGRQFKKKKCKPYGNFSLGNIINGDCLVNHQLYYCPECIKDGFHSIYHQLSYIDRCLLHPDQKLIKLCDCNYTYSLQATNSSKPFACPVCQKQMPTPQDSGVIVHQWIKPKKVEVTDDLILSQKNIEVIDFRHLSKKREVCLCITPKYCESIFILSPDNSFKQNFFKNFYNKLLEEYSEEQIYEVLTNYRMRNYYKNEIELDIIAKIYFLFSIYEPEMTGLFMFREGRLRINIDEENIMEQTLFWILRKQSANIVYNVYKILSESCIYVIKQLIKGRKYLGLNEVSIYSDEKMPIIVISKSDVPNEDIRMCILYENLQNNDR